MNNERDNKLISSIELGLVLIMFFVISFLVQRNLEFFKQFINYNFLGVLIYIIIVIIAIIFAPISSIPLIPLMSGIWGWIFTGLISWLSWTAGAIIVFYISRKWGVTLVSKLIPIKSLRKIEKKIPTENEFWIILLLRMMIPVDILSYALGLFSDVSFAKYLLATAVGILPVTFLLAYAGAVSFKMQMIIFGLVVLIAFIVLMTREILEEKKLKKLV